MDANEGSLSRLTKCLELTASNHDGEALSAVRRANVIRESLALMWSDIILPSPHPSAPESQQGQEDFKEIFETIWNFNPLGPKWRAIVANIEEFHRARGFLTPKQKKLIMKFHATAMANRAAGKDAA